MPGAAVAALDPLRTRRALFVSINRFERKKNIGLAVRALAHVVADDATTLPRRASPQLVVAGGYDARVAENVEHHLELVELARSLNLSVGDFPDCEADVVFLRSFDDVQRNFLLTRATAIIYTPENEHFGIVPVEAMFMRRPVIACASGGPLETVGMHAPHSARGQLCASEPHEFAAAMRALCIDLRGSSGGSGAAAMGARGRAAMLELFSFDAFAAKLVAAVRSEMQRAPPVSLTRALRLPAALVALTLLVAAVVHALWHAVVRASHRFA